MYIAKIRKIKPLIHHITNYVTVNDCANATIALGASPIMADFDKEQEEFSKISNCLVLNTGTINERVAKAMYESVAYYEKLNKAIILDPVAMGVTCARNEINSKLLSNKISIIKANASEIASIIGLDGKAKGTDNTFIINDDFLQKAQEYTQNTDRILAVTGEIDFIISKDKIAKIYNGSIMATKITGAGCMCASVCGVFAGVIEDKFQASLYAMLSFNIACELAQINSKGTGSFRMNLLDELSNISDEDIKNKAKYELI
ncbi:hydroxyethylthiazole kinase [Campylobacter volucris]|uniref:hydroxyethylthiazole kinase n=1 Tax=Campylobacter volucris TaxID=1031542 RepID=UPI00189DECDE|nr:hydroxyethylthiazole kinase [Campylobacter volucris]MBF7047153.1 hydroxyethylthiazole kinase [Campylobacter volucris]